MLTRDAEYGCIHAQVNLCSKEEWELAEQQALQELARFTASLKRFLAVYDKVASWAVSSKSQDLIIDVFCLATHRSCVSGARVLKPQ